MPPARDQADPSSPGNQRTQEVLQQIVTGRKSWKTLRGDTEPVWPPQLEAALINGLENYQPDNSRETRLLGRFPKRNRFISDYIFTVTGKRRTAKQVGSRLQQLRDTYAGEPLLKLLLHTHEDHDLVSNQPSSPNHQASSESDRPALRSSSNSSASLSCPVSPPETNPLTSKVFCFDPDASLLPQTTVYIDILPAWSHPCDADFAAEGSLPSVSHLPEGSHDEGRTFRPSPYPRSLWNIDPTLTFISPSTINAHSIYTVSVDELVVHTEITDLILVEGLRECKGALLYSTPLVPGYWKTICRSADPTRFTIVQSIVPNSTPPPSDPIRSTDVAVMFSATYKFNFPDGMSSLPASPLTQPGSSTDMDVTNLQVFSEFSSTSHISGSTVNSSRSILSCGEPEPYYRFYDQAESKSSRNRSDNGASNAASSSCFPTELSNYIL